MSMSKDEISQALSGLVEDGSIEITGVDEDGELLFLLTEKGLREAEEVLRRRGVDPIALKDMNVEEFREAIGLEPDA